MKLILTTDWQLHDAPAFDRIDGDTQRSTRFTETVETIERVLDTGMAAGADGLFFGGDLTEHKKPTPLESTAAARLFTRVMDKGGFVWALAGNHDGAIFEQSSSSLEPLARMRADQFKLFHDIEVDTELGVLAIPYQHKTTPLQITERVKAAWIRALATTSPKPGQKFFAAAHYGVIGATVGPKAQQLPDADYLGTEQLLLKTNPLDFVYCGHIHQGQEMMLDGVRVFIAGSPTQQNRGERNDRKTWGLFNTVTRELQVFEIPQPRKFVEVPYSEFVSPQGSFSWHERDIVTITGEYLKPDYPKDTVEAVINAGNIPRPFALNFETKPKRDERAARSMEISTEGGLRSALQIFLKEKYPNTSGEGNIVGPAAELAMGLLEEQGLKLYHTHVDPVSLSIKDFLTFRHYEALFAQGIPTLIVGKNGIGKTNYYEAILWTLTGETSKNLNLAAVVRQNNPEARVVLDLVGHDGAYGNAQRYRITRGVKLAKSGKPTQSLDVVLIDVDGRVKQLPDGKGPVTLSDGSQAEVQMKINALIGGTYLTLKTSAFKFQNDTSPFIRTKPTERKAVIGELTGLEPLARTFKILDARRLESARAYKSAEDRLGGMVAVAESQDEREALLKADLVKAQAELVDLRPKLVNAEMELQINVVGERSVKDEVTRQLLKLDELPDTGVTVAECEQELVTYKATQEKALADKRMRYRALETEIAELQAALKLLNAVAPEAIAAAETVLAASKTALAAAQGINTSALATAQVSQAAGNTAAQQLKQLVEEAQTLKSRIMAQPAPVDVEAKRLQLVQLQAQVDGNENEARDLTGHVTVWSAAVKDANDKLQTLKVEAAAFDGKDIGVCSSCGQDIDSSHIEKELARIEKDRKLEMDRASLASDEKDVAEKKLGSVLLEKMKAITELTTLRTEIEAAALNVQQARALQAQADEINVKTETVLVKVAETKQAAYDTLLASQAAAQTMKGAQALVDQQQKELDALNLQASAVATKSGRLQALTEEHTKNVEAGIRDKAEMEARIHQLQEALGMAAKADLENQAVDSALRAELVKLQALATSAAEQLMAVSNAASSARTAVALGEQAEKNLASALKVIDDGRTAVQAAQMELGTLKQQSEIDAMACSLVDPKVGLPVYLIDQALPFLEDRINLYMGQLGMDRLTVELTTQNGDAETLAVLVDNGRPGPRLDIAAFSGGQLDRVELAVKMAMADLARQSRGVTFGGVFYDEPTGGLDEDGKEGLIKILHERVATYPVTYVVSHDEKLIGSFSHRLQFKQGIGDETEVAA